MSGLKCPYCGCEISGTETKCSSCGNDLITQCQFCKQSISVYEEVCPYCSTRLKKKSYKNWFYGVGLALSIMWALLMSGIIVVFVHYPTLLKYTSKRGDDFASSFIELCFKLVIVTCVPYIVSLVKKYNVKASVISLVINIILAIAFSVYVLHLNVLARAH